MKWRIIHKEVTKSTNLDALGGRPGDVFTADFQTAGRGRLDHKWVSSHGENVIMSAVLDVADVDVAEAATIPLVVGLAVVEAVRELLPEGAAVMLKWPNDVYVDGRKIAGILCERHGERVIAGIGVNVAQDSFPPDVDMRAVSFKRLGVDVSIEEVRDAVLQRLDELLEVWLRKGFAALYPRIRAVDWLRGRTIGVVQTDSDNEPTSGVSGGIMPDGSLDVGGVCVWAGEAHVSSIRTTGFLV